VSSPLVPASTPVPPAAPLAPAPPVEPEFTAFVEPDFTSFAQPAFATFDAFPASSSSSPVVGLSVPEARAALPQSVAAPSSSSPVVGLSVPEARAALPQSVAAVGFDAFAVSAPHAESERGPDKVGCTAAVLGPTTAVEPKLPAAGLLLAQPPKSPKPLNLSSFVSQTPTGAGACARPCVCMCVCTSARLCVCVYARHQPDPCRLR
jgi:hypothetical protein